jgi:hypothetical protein
MALVNISSNMLKIITNYAQTEANNHVFITAMFDTSDPTDRYKATCNVCHAEIKWTYDFDETFGVDLKWLCDFCRDHRHSDSNTMVDKVEIKKQEQKNKPIMVVPSLLPKAEPIEPVNVPMMADFQFYPGGRRMNSVSVSQETLKEIAKLSSFNVDLQAKVLRGIATEYRAICTACGQDCSLDFEELVGSKRDTVTWKKLTAFCEVHSHVKKVEWSEGRKFRDASYAQTEE